MTISVSITTGNNVQARVTHGADVTTVPPGTEQTFCLSDGNPTLTVLEQPAREEGEIGARSGGGGHGVPTEPKPGG